jgi:hypothetical protein
MRLIDILFPYNYFAGIFLKLGKGEFVNTKKYQAKVYKLITSRFS